MWKLLRICSPRRATGRSIDEGEVVGVRGFEPPTPASRTQYSTRLSYTPKITIRPIYTAVGSAITVDRKVSQV